MKKVFLITIFFIGLVLSRTYKIDRLPASLFTDELSYAIEAKSLAVSGVGLNGWNPWSLSPFEKAYAELPAVIMVPGFFLSPDPLVAAKFSSLILSILFPFVFAWFVYGLFQDKHVAVISLIVTAFNPWLWQMGRMTLDPFFSLFFFFLGFAILLNARGRSILFSVLFLVIGFFQYQGMKLIIVPLTFIFAFIRHKRHPNRSLIAVIISISLLFGWYVLIKLPSQGAQGRLSGQIMFMNKDYLQQAVDSERKVIFSTSFNRFLVNKITVGIQRTLRKYANALDPDLLFFGGEGYVNQYAVNSHGLFYLIDGLLIVLGFIQIATKKPLARFRIPFVLLLIVSPIPAVVNIGSAFTLRASFLYLLLLILVSLGIRSITNRLLSGIIIAAYLGSIGLFSYHYFVKYPIYAADNTNFSERLLSEYISRAADSGEVVVYTSEPNVVFGTFIYYNNLITVKNKENLQPRNLAVPYQFENVTVSTECFDPNRVPTVTTVVAQSAKHCQSSLPALAVPQPFLSISRIADAGEVYRIYNDRVCTSTHPGAYIRLLDDTAFSLKSLADNAFCTQWITNLSEINDAD